MIPVLGGTGMSQSGQHSPLHPHSDKAEMQASDVTEKDNPNKEAGERETWGKKIDFFLALVGFSVGLGNVWRFPYLCYKNGGGAFLIPYLICVVIGALPLLLLEISLGQFMAQGGINAWAICPILQGIGWATTTIIFFVNCYYEVILAWAFYYFFSSFTTKLPWDSCGNYWNTPNCNDLSKRDPATQVNINTSRVNDSSVDYVTQSAITTGFYDYTIDNDLANVTSVVKKVLKIDPVTEFWENKVLEITNGIEDSGGIKWDICLCLLLSWVVVFFCICKGVKSSGKVVYFTATAPYALMFVLLIRGVTLPGAIDGIKFYVIPDFEKLATMEVWVDAGTQVFFSYAIGIGGLTALGSYNTWNHNSYRDSILFAITNSGTSVFAGFVIFSVLGFMAKEAGVDVGSVAESGPGLAFVAYPKAVSQMPIAPLWSIVFFFMIILLGLDSQFVGVEGLVTAIQDTFPVLRANEKRKTCFVAVTVFVHFLVGLPMCSRGGMYVFQLFDYYPASRIVVLVGFLECITVSWFYGVNRYYDNLEMMFGFRINIWMKICWLGLCPVYCLAIFLMSTVNYSTLTYKRPIGTYVYPSWAVGLGWTLAIIPVIFIFATAVYRIYENYRDGEPMKKLIQPRGLKRHQLRPEDQVIAESPPSYAYATTDYLTEYGSPSDGVTRC